MNINEEKTLQYFGYTSDMLSRNSREPVIIYCNQTGNETSVSYIKYNKVCKDCKVLPTNPCLKSYEDSF